MENKFLFYIRSQFLFFFSLVIFSIIPLILFFLYSPYELPNIEYAILAIIIMTQYLFFHEKNYRRQVTPRVIDQLCNKLKRRPSQKQIVRKVEDYVFGRNAALIFNIIILIFVIIFFRTI